MPDHLICNGCGRNDFKARNGLSAHESSCLDRNKRATGHFRTLHLRAKRKAQAHNSDNSGASSHKRRRNDLLLDDPQGQEPVRVNNEDERELMESEMEYTAVESHTAQSSMIQAPLDVPNSLLIEKTQQYPAKHRDIVPVAGPLATHAAIIQEDPPLRSGPDPATPSRGRQFITPPNPYGVYRRYYYKPTYDPNGVLPSKGLSRAACSEATDDPTSQEFLDPLSTRPPYYPFPNYTQYLLSSYSYTSEARSGECSAADYNAPVKTLMTPGFVPQDLQTHSAAQRDSLLDRYGEGILGEGEPEHRGGWTTNVKVPIQIPEGKKNWTNSNGQTYHISGLHHQSIVDIVKQKFETNKYLHYTPFEMWWCPPNGSSEQCLYGDISSSDSFITAMNEVHNDPFFQVPNYHLEKVVACVMVYSDSTHLAQFGSASLWPIYVFSGNADSWFRMSSNTDADDHWAYIPSLPQDLRGFIYEISSQASSPQMFMHCRREMVQAVWKLLLDKDFKEAYRHGIIVQCADGIFRRIYIRLMTYAADYPEKMIMLSLRDKGNCPCLLCELPKNLISQLGLQRDREKRKYLARVDSDNTAVDSLLKDTSHVPTINAFSEIIMHPSFNKYQMFTVDLLHEVELGVWKSILIHLVRLMETLGAGTVEEFNRRFNALKKLAARDFEDLLQCAWPVLEGLFPNDKGKNHDAIVQTLVFTMASWHSLAKLRLHMEKTLQELDNLTTQLGRAIRKFNNNARRRHQILKKNLEKQSTTSNECKRKFFNTSTPKLHLLGHYVDIIRWYGATLGLSTQRGELAHRKVKRRYRRVSKADPALGMTKIERREAVMREIDKRVTQAARSFEKDSTSAASTFRRESVLGEPEPGEVHDNNLSEESLSGVIHPSQHHYISEIKVEPVYIQNLLQENVGDPAIENFYDNLKNHLFACLQEVNSNDDEMKLTHEQRKSVLIKDNQIFFHRTCSINFTTYDVRRAQDTINTNTSRRDILLNVRDDPKSCNHHPYWYARVIKIFHVLARENKPNTVFKSFQVLWIRWLGHSEQRITAAVNVNGLDRVGFVGPHDKTDRFGFIDPNDVIRACHLIPAFHYGCIDELPANSLAHPGKDPQEDWAYFYVNRFIDHDMYMRYKGGGVGHTIHYDSVTPESIPKEPDEAQLAMEEAPESSSTGEIFGGNGEMEEMEVESDLDESDEEHLTTDGESDTESLEFDALEEETGYASP
ncbi:hypothetical protein M422DRAFT_247583 [Sphaerobolus stellatus SS14]|nr:hypothetical protein M422DRAFT_247583 [Sphaerobolus stellatus SS14]